MLMQSFFTGRTFHAIAAFRLMLICLTYLTRIVFLILVRISPIRNLDPFLEIILCKLFFCFFCKKNIILRFHILYPFNMMRYRTLLRFALEPIAKPSQAKPNQALGTLRTTVTKLVPVFVPWWMSLCHSHVNTMFSTGVEIKETASLLVLVCV
jgi:hypothetical protein